MRHQECLSVAANPRWPAVGPDRSAPSASGRSCPTQVCVAKDRPRKAMALSPVSRGGLCAPMWPASSPSPGPQSIPPPWDLPPTLLLTSYSPDCKHTRGQGCSLCHGSCMACSQGRGTEWILGSYSEPQNSPPPHSGGSREHVACR